MSLIYLAIGRDAIRATVPRTRGAPIAREVARTTPGLAEDLSAIIGALPKRRIGKRHVIVGLTPPDVRVKTLFGLPGNLDVAALRRVVSQQVSRFFLGSSPTIVHVQAAIVDGAPVAALYDDAIVSVVIDACRRHNVGVECFVPGSNIAARTQPDPLAYRLTDTGQNRRGVRVVTVAGLLFSILAASGARGIRATYDLREMQPRLSALASLAPLADSVESYVGKARFIDAAVQGFRSNRASVAELLGVLSYALPESTAIISLRADSTGAAIALQSTDAARVVAALLENPFFRSAQLQGRVAEESNGSAKLQRASLRLVTVRSSPPRTGRR